MSDITISTLIPVLDETISLEKTVDIVEEDCGDDILEHLILISDTKTTQASMKVVEKLKEKYPKKIHVYSQSLPYMGGAIRKGFENVKGTHCVLLSSDLETDPYLVKTFIANIKKEPDVLFTANRWKKGYGFKGYDPLKLVLNFIFQKIIAVMYWRNLHDFTFGYRIFETKLVQKIRWEGLKHPFLLETILKPLKLGVKVKELPVAWEARTEGVSHNSFWTNFRYLGMAVKILFMKKKDILR